MLTLNMLFYVCLQGTANVHTIHLIVRKQSLKEQTPKEQATASSTEHGNSNETPSSTVQSSSSSPPQRTSTPTNTPNNPSHPPSTPANTPMNPVTPVVNTVPNNTGFIPTQSHGHIHHSTSMPNVNLAQTMYDPQSIGGEHLGSMDTLHLNEDEQLQLMYYRHYVQYMQSHGYTLPAHPLEISGSRNHGGVHVGDANDTNNTNNNVENNNEQPQFNNAGEIADYDDDEGFLERAPVESQITLFFKWV
eukprot:Pgem_evm1s5466